MDVPTKILDLGMKSNAELPLRRAKSVGSPRAIGPFKKSGSLRSSSLPSNKRAAYTDFLYNEVVKEESEVRSHAIDVENTSGEVFIDSTDLKAESLKKKYSLANPAPQMEKSRLAVLLLDQDPFSVYKCLFLLSIASNLILLTVAACGHYEYANNNGALFALANVLVLVLMRNEVFLRLVFWMTVLLFGHLNVPLRLKKWITHALQNLGGIHSGCGVASVVWTLHAIIHVFHHRELIPKSTETLLIMVFFLLLISCLAACPLLRHVHHNYFENTHRICGWAALALIWCFVLLSASYDPSTTAYHFTAKKTVHRTDIWFAALLTILVFLPWVLIRKVPVRICTPSDAVSLITFPNGLPVGVLGRISRSPFSDWHAFGIASDGFSENTMICGAVGDFTKGLVSNPPTHLWTRKVRFAGVAYLANMYRRAVFVATGSGLGPFLSFLMQPSKVDVHLIWIAKDMNRIYGEFVSDILDRFPKEKLILHDTALLGRPNVEKLVVDKVRECGAELVIVTSNPAGSKRVIDSCTAAGIAAFGPVWDS